MNCIDDREEYQTEYEKIYIPDNHSLLMILNKLCVFCSYDFLGLLSLTDRPRYVKINEFSMINKMTSHLLDHRSYTLCFPLIGLTLF